MKTQLSLLLRLSLLISLIVASANISYAQQTEPTGKTLYEKKCASCHGSNGTKHLLGAKDLRKSKLSDDAILKIVNDGKGLMPSYKKKLTSEEILLILDYVKSIRQ